MPQGTRPEVLGCIEVELARPIGSYPTASADNNESCNTLKPFLFQLCVSDRMIKPPPVKRPQNRSCYTLADWQEA